LMWYRKYYEDSGRKTRVGSAIATCLSVEIGT
jgi:hypothetical protein